MCLFSKKQSILRAGLLNNMTDIHSHILYGVDDGMQTQQQSLEALEVLEKQGISSIYLTPHIMEDSSQDRVRLLCSQFEELKAAYKGNIRLQLAAEYMLDNEFETLLADSSNKLLTLGENHVLLETSYINPPLGFHTTLKKVIKQGYFVVLAHPERYLYMEQSDYKKLKSTNALCFQLNLLSLVGCYGKSAQKKAFFLLRNDYYDFAGSDIHNLDFHLQGYNRNILSNADVKKLQQLLKNNSRFC